MTTTYHIIGERHRDKDAPSGFHTRERGEPDRDGKRPDTRTAAAGKVKDTLDALHAAHLAAVQDQHKDRDGKLPEVSVIAEDITIENDKARGILNCRVNGKHVQYRFAE